MGPFTNWIIFLSLIKLILIASLRKFKFKNDRKINGQSEMALSDIVRISLFYLI